MADGTASMGLTVRAERLCFSYGAQPVLVDIDLEELVPGQVAALVGPNATGKSTLFKCLAGLLEPEGSVYIGGERSEPGRRRPERAARIAYLPQEFPVATALTVFEAVLIAGRRARGWGVTAEQADEVSAVLDRLDIEHLASRYLTELSGGQRQLVSVAQALARRPEILLLDEPISNLDLHHQLQMLTHIRAITRLDQITTVIAIHDLNLAARFADRLLVLHHGRFVADGPPDRVLTAALLREVYCVEATVTTDEDRIPVVVAHRALSADSGPAGDDSHPAVRPTEAPPALRHHHTGRISA